MDIFSQGIYLLLFPLLLIIIVIVGFISINIKPIPNSEQLQEKLKKFYAKIRKLLLLDSLKIRVGDKDGSRKKTK